MVKNPLVKRAWVRSPLWEDSTQLSLDIATTGPVGGLDLETASCSERSHCNEKPEHRNERSPCSLQLGKAHVQ